MKYARRFSPSKTWTVSEAGFVLDGLQLYAPESEGRAPRTMSWLTVEERSGERVRAMVTRLSAAALSAAEYDGDERSFGEEGDQDVEGISGWKGSPYQCFYTRSTVRGSGLTLPLRSQNT